MNNAEIKKTIDELKEKRKELEATLSQLIGPHLRAFESETGVGICGLFGQINIVEEHGRPGRKYIFHGVNVDMDLNL